VLTVSWDTIRLFLHVLAATVWVGGQLTLAGLVPALRTSGGDVTRVAAARFNALAWPAFAVLVVTGVWNILALSPSWSSTYGTTLIVKIVLAVASGVAAFLHIKADSRTGLAVFGAISSLTAIAALFLGVLLAG
jgi:putative copper export protein